ncbi:MAG: UDP-glucose 4-epimerase [Algoriphagus sp.]|jgi:UDP-glucose 4-epimerase
MNMNVLVTGGAGFIGSHVSRHCLELGFNTVVLDDLSGGFKDNVPEGCTFIQGSIENVALINKLFEEYKFDYIYHLAAYAAEGLSHFIRRFNYNNNLIGTINLINASVNAGTVKRFVFTSSIAVYGAGQVPMTEEMTPTPEDPYGISKYAAELDLRAAHEMFGLNFTIFRPHNVYGENQNMGDRYRNVIGIFMNQIMSGKSMTIFGDGKQTRAFSHVDDVAPIIASCVNMKNSENEVFNIGAEKPYSVLELAEITSKSFGVEPNINFLEARNEVVDAFSDHSKVDRVFGTQDYISLEQGIKQMSAWAKDKGPRESSIFSGIEVSKNMPASWKAVMNKS